MHYKTEEFLVNPDINGVMIFLFLPQIHALKCKEHFERTLVRPVGRSAGLREVNERKFESIIHILMSF